MEDETPGGFEIQASLAGREELANLKARLARAKEALDACRPGNLMHSPPSPQPSTRSSTSQPLSPPPAPRSQYVGEGTIGAEEGMPSVQPLTPSRPPSSPPMRRSEGSCGRSTSSSIWDNTNVGGAYFQKPEAHPDAFEVKQIEAHGPLDACKVVSVGDHIIAVDGQSVHRKNLTQLAMTVMGTPNSSIECPFRQKDTRELITVSLVRDTKGGAGSQAQTSAKISQAQTSEKISQAEENHPIVLSNQTSAAVDSIDCTQLARHRFVSLSQRRICTCVSPADEES